MISFSQENLLEEGESILFPVRKHWIVYASDFILHTTGCLFFLLCVYILEIKSSLLGIFSTGGVYLSMVFLMFVLIFWTSFFCAWTLNYFDVWYLTKKHIIAIDQKQLFIRDEAFMEFVRIQDVLFEKNGVLAHLLGFGTLRVQSAGTEQEFTMSNVADIEAVAHRIMALRDEAQGKQTISPLGEMQSSTPIPEQETSQPTI
jgi:membrane protein YdbS with pleckstrin-like domain